MIGANTFDGPVTVSGGTLRLAHPQAHGLASATRAIAGNTGYSLVLDALNGNITIPDSHTLRSSFAGHFTVNKGLATSEVPLATDGTAVLTLPPPAGTLLILR